MICYLRRDLIAVMRKQLKFRPEIVTATRKTFKRVAKKMEVPVKKLTFVGVHNRFGLIRSLKIHVRSQL